MVRREGAEPGVKVQSKEQRQEGGSRGRRERAEERGRRSSGRHAEVTVLYST